MNNHSNVRRALTGLTAAALLAGTAVAASAVTARTIEAQYMGIQLVVDGVAVTPMDAQGKAVEPFVSEGTTYLPVRAVANALGKEVKWDGETKTVYIGDIPGQAANWMKELPPYSYGHDSDVYDGGDPKHYFTVSGEDHLTGVRLSDTTNLKDEGHVLWNTNALYRSMTFTIGHVDDTLNWSGTLEVYLDGVYTTSYDLRWDMPAQTMTIPLNYASNVKLVLNSQDKNSYVVYQTYAYGLYDISFAQ